MKKIAVAAAVIVIVAGGVFAGVSYYENQVARGLQEMINKLPANVEAAMGDVDYSLLGNSLLIKDFKIKISEEQGEYVISADEVAADGLDASVFRSGVPARLAKLVVLKNCRASMPGGVTVGAEIWEMSDISGPFGTLADLIRAKAGPEKITPVACQIRCGAIDGKNMVYESAGESCSIASFQAREAAFLHVKDSRFSDIKLRYLSPAGASQTAGAAEMRLALDFTPLAGKYVPGEGRELLTRLFMELLNPRIPASLSLELNNMEFRQSEDRKPVKLDSLNFNYVNNDKEMELQWRLGDFIFANLTDVGPENIVVTMRFDANLNEEQFKPINFDMDFKELGKFNLQAEVLGRSSSGKLRRLEAQYEDGGLIELTLRDIARQNNVSVEDARQMLRERIANKLSNARNQFLADLGQNLEKLLAAPGVIRCTIAPDQPLSTQQFALYAMFNPAALNYNIQTTENR